MPPGRERAAEILRGPDGDQLWLALVDFARKFAQRRGWRVGKTVPGASDPDAVAKDVISKVLQGERTWDESKEPDLLKALKGMVRSDIGHLFDGYEASHIEPIDSTLPDGSTRTADDLGGNAADPEEELLQDEQAQLEMTALDLIREAVEGKPELELVFLALHESENSKEISRLTGLSIERVYSLRRELGRIAARIGPARVAREAIERRTRG